mgnify:CR=1 FL=1
MLKQDKQFNKIAKSEAGVSKVRKQIEKLLGTKHIILFAQNSENSDALNFEGITFGSTKNQITYKFSQYLFKKVKKGLEENVLHYEATDEEVHKIMNSKDEAMANPDEAGDVIKELLSMLMGKSATKAKSEKPTEVKKKKRNYPKNRKSRRPKIADLINVKA